MKGRNGLLLALVMAAGPAWGQSEEELTAAVGPEITAYAVCLKQQTQELARGNELAEAIVTMALSACAERRQDLLIKLQAPPLNAGPDESADAVQELDDALRPKMLHTIQEVRGS